MGGFTREHQPAHKQSPDEWDFKDESNIYANNFREAKRLSKKSLDCRNINCHFSSHPSSKSVCKAVNSSSGEQSRGKPPSSRQNIVRDLFINPNTTLGKYRSKCLTRNKEINMTDENYVVTSSHCTNHSKNRMEESPEQYGHFSEAHLQDVGKWESFSDVSQFKNKVTPNKATTTWRSHFLSSMDDGELIH